MRVVRCPQRTDLALFFEPFEHIEAFLDGDEVVYLVELDPAVEEVQGVLDLVLRLPVVGSPNLGPHGRLVATMFSPRAGRRGGTGGAGAGAPAPGRWKCELWSPRSPERDHVFSGRRPAPARPDR